MDLHTVKFIYYTDVIHYSVPSAINEPIEDLGSRSLGCEKHIVFNTSEELVSVVEDILSFS